VILVYQKSREENIPFWHYGSILLNQNKDKVILWKIPQPID
jgi:hypothetical protein